MLRIRTLVTGVAGSPWYVNTYFNGDTVTEAQDASAKMAVFWDSVKLKMLSGLTIQVSPEVVSVEPATGEMLDFFTVARTPINAAASGLPLPFSNQALVRITTDAVRAGRRVQGRILLPGFVVGEQSGDGTPTAGSVSTTTTLAQALVDPASTSGLGVWSRPVFGNVIDPLPPVIVRPGAFFSATSAVMQDKWAVLRSRRD